MVKALLIEDDRKLSELLREFLGQHGVEAVVAPDGVQALSLLTQHRFDILLLDLMLAREVRVDGVRQSLTAHEYQVLAALARNAGRVLTREQLLDLVKGEQADEAFDRSIDVHVSRLRQKIEIDPRHPRYVKTVRGAGYLLARES
ncbi:MAG: response regulator transcription factor [Deltaproteobacteria bacterium]|nr:MAG: response regulator transcription factor [Deltaproteobacteria bacterium]